MKKKIIYVICIMISFSLGIAFSVLKNNKVVINETNNETSSGLLAIMVFDENTNNYIKQDYVPIGAYKLNLEKTKCLNGGIINSYNNTTGKIQYSIIGTDECSIYFDALEMYISPQTNLSSGIQVLAGKTNSDNTFRVANQNGYRYEGIEPSNYLYFNCSDTTDVSTCEKWRIIGTFEGSINGLTSGKYYTKIIRNSSIGDMAWDTNTSSNWSSSTLYSYLNGTYYSSLSTSAKSVVKNVKWYWSTWRGASVTNSDETALIFYGYDSSGTSYVTNYVGLSYFSDLAYATYAGDQNPNCDNEGSLTVYKQNSCSIYNWLATDFKYWSMNPNSGGVATGLAFIFQPGEMPGFYSGANQTDNGGVLPSVYLDYSVNVTGGDGTFENPYTIF